ncbi:MAG: hypothetical protein K6V97_02345 [Actinomycetia bacterium]|nr:hypothetical protein [Actinomycetes bacterium]
MATLTVVTDRFVNLAQAEAEALGRPDLRLVVVPHPFGGVPEATIRERARALAPEIAARLVQPDAAPAAEPDRSAEPEPPPELVLRKDPDEEWAWAVARLELSDGLPVVLPTADRVRRMLRYCDRDPETPVGPVPPRWATATIATLAANAVMAGCRPEQFPVVLAAVEAMLDPVFNLYGIQATTHPVGPLVLLSGPLAAAVGVASGAGCLGPGWQANLSIGRAIRLILMNIGGARPGVLDKATMGQPGKIAAVLAENEAESPWPPFRADFGYGPEVTTISVFGAEAPHNINDHGSTTAEGILRTVAGTMATTGNNNLYWQGDTLVLFGPEHAATLAREGLGKEDVRRELHRRARVPVAAMSAEQFEHTRGWAVGDRYVDDAGRVAVTAKPEEIRIAVAGGPGKHSMWVPTFGLTYSVTRPLVDRTGRPIRSLEEVRQW